MAQEVHAAHILVKTEEKAKEILGKLRLGESFEKLAEENSICPSRKRGGDLGWFGRQKMVREFELAAFSLQKDQISAPIKTQFGWHIIKLIDSR